MIQPPQFKVCRQCGATCEATIKICPGFIKTVPGSNPCLSSDFRDITIKDLKTMDGDSRIKVYFQKWPEWPTKKAWQQITGKDGLEKTPPK